MFLNHIISWGMAAMLTSLTMTTGSVDSNSTLSQNNNPAPVEEATEGCATHFGKRTDLMFKYILDDYDQHLVEDLDNWEYIGEFGDVDPECNQNADERACVISVSEDDVIGTFPNFQLNPNIRLSSQAKPASTIVYHIIGATNVNSFDYYNEEDL